MPTYRQRLKPRFAILGGIVLLVLGVLLGKLWTMQVLQGSAYAARADQNRVREVTTLAPRGRILDRNGVPLVTNRPSLAVLVAPTAREDAALLSRLSALLNIPVAEIEERLDSVRESALAPRVVAIDVPMEQVAYLAEHESDFPGVEIQTRAVREYPEGTVAAHVLGYTGEISEEDLNSAEFAGYESTDVVGKTGAERSFESVLQGDRGTRRLEVNANGQPQAVLAETEPVPGRDVVLTIDLKVQKIAEKALRDALDDAHQDDYAKAKAGAAVALDVRTGEVLAMASLPTYDPEVFLGGISEDKWRALTSKSSEYPLSNRVIAGQYPPASTFKAMTGLAGLEYGFTSQWATYYCAGRWTGMGEDWAKYCWNRSGHGTETFMDGMADSCDTVFYEIGHAAYREGGEKIQTMAREFGFGQELGLDLPGETSGRVPDAAWKKMFNEDYPEYQQWLPGDTVNMAIGQGDMLVTPLQMASAYGAIANGGEVLRPRVMKRVLGNDGEPVLEPEPEVALTPKVSKKNLDIMQAALEGVVTRGTAASAFRGFGVQTAGKTGTAQVTGKDDYAWYVGYGPVDDPRYVVAVVIEQGGHGGAVAAPAARQILAALLGQEVEHVTAEDSSR
jgi:penicillin-binding protein 2